MNYEASKQLTDARFKRLVGVQRTTFEEMLAVLKTAYQLKHAKGGRKPKLSLEDLLMATLQYVREYRTYEEIAADLGIHESNLIRRSQWVEVTLVQRWCCGKILADSDYQGLMKIYPQAQIPRKSSKLKPLTVEDKTYNHALSKDRSKVENIFAKVKTFKMFSTTCRNHRKRFGLRMNLSAGIINHELGF
ncbi:transposase family protein [Streptococcus pneumoniae]|uniref:transposase family protein n=1 Tax=Streptococcus pneumoniae TaxID=1313 RepID=UPI00099594E4|nr:transposase family protein [Streptococcus pneumoniae]